MNLQFSQTQLFSIFIVLIMMASTVSIALLSQDPNPQPNPNQPDQPLNPGNQTTLPYSVTVNASVVQQLPRVILFATTDESDIQVIDTRLVSIPGIRLDSFNSYFRNDPSTGGLIYVAEVSFDPNQTNTQKLISDAGNINVFTQQPFGFAQALVSVPKNVTFHNTDFDVNHAYTFLDPLVPSYVSPETRPKDQIQVQLDAKFTGNTISELIASEVSNPLNDPKQRSATRLLTLDELKPLLVFGADTNYSASLDVNTLLPRLEQLPDVNQAQVTYSLAAPATVQFFFQDQNTRDDINQFFSDYNRISSFQLQSSATGFDIVLALQNPTEFESVKTDVTAKLSAKGMTPNQSFRFVSPVYRLRGQLETTKTDLNATATQLRSLLNLGDGLEVYQLGTSNTTYIQESMLDENSQKYFFDQNTMPIQVLPGKTVGQPVVIKIDFVTVRDKIVQLFNASEVKGMEGQPLPLGTTI